MFAIDGVYLWFNYDPTHKFVKDLYKFWSTEIIFEAIEDRLLINLYYSQKNTLRFRHLRVELASQSIFYLMLKQMSPMFAKNIDVMTI